MDEMRYRKPSVKTVLGLTRMKKRLNKTLGVTTLLAPFRAVKNYQRRLLRRAGYYSPEMKALRAAGRGQVAGPIGPLQVGTPKERELHSPAETALLAAALTKSGGAAHGQGHETHDQQSPGLAQAMLLSTALKGKEQEHEQGEAQKQKTIHAPASTARVPRTEKRATVKKRTNGQ